MSSRAARPHPASAPPGGILLLSICFFLSGFGSLVLEVVWTRQLRLSFGSTTLAASTILVAYMLGLGLGGLGGGRLAGRVRDGVRTYGWLEVAIGLYAVAVPHLLSWFPAIDRALLYGLAFWPAAFARFVLALSLFIVPTLLMGATLPILVATLARHDPRIARTTGLLYGVNTLGAVAGVFVATFVLFPAIGIWRATLVGAAIATSVGVLAITIVPRVLRRGAGDGAAQPASDATAPAEPGRADDRPARPRAVLVTYAGVGFAALVCEVGWMRGLAVVLGSSIYGFAAMLGAFLAGIGLGSLLFRGVVQRARRPTLLLALALVSFGVLSLLVTLAIPFLPRIFLRLLLSELRGGEAVLVPAQVVICLLALLPPTLVLGGLFPLLTRIVGEGSDDPGAAVGRVYFANTMGSATGAFAAGFVLLPAIGIERTLALASATVLALAAPFLAAGRGTIGRVASFGVALAAVALLLAPLPFDRVEFTRGVFQQPDGHRDFGIAMLPFEGEPQASLLYYRDGINATISVQHLGGHLALKINGKVDASNGSDMGNQILPAHLPLLFGPPARDVLVIGYASGVTVGSVARHPDVARIDTVELEPAVIEASRFFDTESGAPLTDPRVRLVLEDGRRWLQSASGTYDVIISQPSNPWMTGVANLFTREFFHAAKEALSPDGRLLQWMQLYGMDPEAIASVIAAMHAEFPYVYGFAGEGQGANVLLLAMQRPLRRDELPRWERLAPAVQEDLRRVGIFSTADLWSLVRTLPADVDAIAKRAATVNSDENLLIELRAPLLSNRVRVKENWATLAPSPGGVLPLLTSLGEPLDRETLGALAFAYAAHRGDFAAAESLLRAAGRQGRAGHAIAAALALVRNHSGTDAVSYESQLATLDEAVALAPGGLEPVLLRGQVRYESERYDLALEDATAALALSPSEPRAIALRMRALAALGRDQEAAADALALLRVPSAESDEALETEQAVLLAAAGDHDEEARALLQRLLNATDPNWDAGWTLLAEVDERSGRTGEAVAARHNAEVARRNRARSLHRMARLALSMDQVDDARTLLTLAVDTDPDYADARAELERLG